MVSAYDFSVNENRLHWNKRSLWDVKKLNLP
jgi:hypothetical protein